MAFFEAITTIEPPVDCALSCRKASRVTRKYPVERMLMLRFHSASEVSSIGAAEAMPALETQMSIPPNATAASA